MRSWGSSPYTRKIPARPPPSHSPVAAIFRGTRHQSALGQQILVRTPRPPSITRAPSHRRGMETIPTIRVLDTSPRRGPNAGICNPEVNPSPRPHRFTVCKPSNDDRVPQLVQPDVGQRTLLPCLSTLLRIHNPHRPPCQHHDSTENPGVYTLLELVINSSLSPSNLRSLCLHVPPDALRIWYSDVDPPSQPSKLSSSSQNW